MLFVDLNNFQFRSSDHIRYENGIDVSGHQKGNNRRIEIKRHPNFYDAYLVTIYNLDGNHPYWQNNIQMAPKRMRIIESNDSMIVLRGFGKDPGGVSFEDYGGTIYIKSGKVEKIVMHMHDRNVYIEYFE